jgi:hypothetical protein
MPSLPHHHRKRRRRVGNAAIMRASAGVAAVLIKRKLHRRVGPAAIMKPGAVLVAALIGTGAVVLRGKLASIVRRSDAAEQ